MLALNEQRLYWAHADSPGVYAVDVSARDTLIVVSEEAAVSSINTLSPGQQIIPGEGHVVMSCAGHVHGVNLPLFLLLYWNFYNSVSITAKEYRKSGNFRAKNN